MSKRGVTRKSAEQTLNWKDSGRQTCNNREKYPWTEFNIIPL